MTLVMCMSGLVNSLHTIEVHSRDHLGVAALEIEQQPVASRLDILGMHSVGFNGHPYVGGVAEVRAVVPVQEQTQKQKVQIRQSTQLYQSH
jgi:hypothetical protein